MQVVGLFELIKKAGSIRSPSINLLRFGLVLVLSINPNLKISVRGNFNWQNVGLISRYVVVQVHSPLPPFGAA